MNQFTLLQSRWIPLFWVVLGMSCWLLPDAASQRWGLLAHAWYWLLLAFIWYRWQLYSQPGDRRASARRRRRPAATRRRGRLGASLNRRRSA